MSPNTDSYGSIPPAPRPSQDAGIRDTIVDTSLDVGIIPSLDQLDIFQLTPKAALKLFISAVTSTVHNEHKTCDPPTPPVSSPTTPKNSSFSDRGPFSFDGTREIPRGRLGSNDIPRYHQTPIGSPEAHPHDIPNIQPPDLEIDVDYTDYEKQCIAMSRAFYSKRPAEIPLEQYLTRIHVYCAMSTGVYLAAACYIQRITRMLWPTSPQDGRRHPILDPVFVHITPRSVHRLALAALRLAHKAMEDNTWAHKRFAGVGGVPNSNLTRLEISMSYLLDFKLYCDNDELADAARAMIESHPGVVAIGN